MSHLPLSPVGTKGMMEAWALKAKASSGRYSGSSSAQLKAREAPERTHTDLKLMDQMWGRSFSWPRNRIESYNGFLGENMPQRQP